MNITSEDEALLVLFENGKTSDKKYKRLPIAAIKGYVKAVNKMRAATRIETLCVIMACATKDCTETEKIKNP